VKADIDRLMAARDLAALLIPISETYSPYLDYLVGRIHVTYGLALKKPGADPLLVVSPMEREEAAASGLTIRTTADLNWAELVSEANGDMSRAQAALWARALGELDVSKGKVGIYGVGSLHGILATTRTLAETQPQYLFCGESGLTLFDEAAVTKDAAEIERIRSVAARTNAVMAATWDFIASHRADGDTVVNTDGGPLTIGDVRRFVRRHLLEHGLEDTGMIFAQGRDGGFPHSRGEDSMALRQGQAIVFDLFPRELGGGYHHDMTRTWCIGYAPDEVQEAYNQVMEAFDIALETFGVDKPTHLAQEAVQDYFESHGHPTLRSDPRTGEGYVHSLGHGIGLRIHERPNMSHQMKDDVFQRGNVITIEPGLYYPERGFGIRVEDALLVDDNGELETLTSFHKSLVLPLRG